MAGQRASGSLFGMAFGDALGAETEFLSVSEILRQFPPSGPHELTGNPARVTDDTQMALAVGRALLNVDHPHDFVLTPHPWIVPISIPGQGEHSYTYATLTPRLCAEFLRWLDLTDNSRAPGNTCLDACYNLEAGKPWYEATVKHSKGCGANMRVAPVGVLPAGENGLTEETRAAIAQLQAAITHGHPTALAASDLTARAIADLIGGGTPDGLPGRLRAYALSQRNVWHSDWLAPLLGDTLANSAEAFIQHGWDECLVVLDRLDKALVIADRTSDPCRATGSGWIAEECLVTALQCFLLFPDDPVAAIRRAAVTSGDSDSIACLTGAFAGAYHGLAAWPESWIARIEYRDELAAMGKAWDR